MFYQLNENKKYHTAGGTVQNLLIKRKNRYKVNNSNTHIYDISLSWLVQAIQ